MSSKQFNQQFSTFTGPSLYNVFLGYIVNKIHIEQVGRLSQTSQAFRDFISQNSLYKKCIHHQPHSEDDLPIKENGNLCWYREGKLYRDGDLPAKVLGNGTQFWYKDGKIHRDDNQPAMVCKNGTQSWYKDGKLHRDEDQPARVMVDGSQEWYSKGRRHRATINGDDLPARVLARGLREWYKDGELCRDGDKPCRCLCKPFRFCRGG